MLGMILTDWSGSGSTVWPFVWIGETHFSGIMSSCKHNAVKSEKKERKKQKYDITERVKLHPCHTAISLFILPFPTIWSYILHHTYTLWPVCFKRREKDVITGIFALLPQQNRISVSRTALQRVVYTHRETRRLMPSGLTEKQAQRTAITCRCSFCPRSHCAWCRGSSGKSRVFFLLIIFLQSQGMFFSLWPFQSLFEEVIIFPSNYIHSIPCGKDIERWNVQIAWGLAFNGIKI